MHSQYLILPNLEYLLCYIQNLDYTSVHLWTVPSMGQYYVLVNVIKAQALWPMLMKVVDFFWMGSFQLELALLLLDLGKQVKSLEKDCQRHLATHKESLATLKMLCEGKVHLVVNLDKKEYLDPRAYGGETNVLDYDKVRFSILSHLIIKLTYSTDSGGGDLPDSITSQGVWAGDQIVIRTAEQLDDFGSFKDVRPMAKLSQTIPLWVLGHLIWSTSWYLVD